MITDWFRLKDRGAIGVTIKALSFNNTSTLIPMGAFVQETKVIGYSTNCYIFGQSAAVTGITLGAKLPNSQYLRIRGPGAFQIGSDGAGKITVLQYVSSLGSDGFVHNVDTGNILLEDGNNLVTELGERLEIESA